MTFSEWLDAVVASFSNRRFKPRLRMDDFAVMIGNYWDGMSPQKQADLLEGRG